jgi:ribosome biogenesis GTPase
MTTSGIVCKVHNNIYTLLDETSKQELLAYKKKSIDNPAVGDQVEYSPDSQGNLITKIKPRRNLIKKPLLANIDLILFVVAIADPDYSFYVIDSFLSYYNHLNVSPVILFNKKDLSSEATKNKLNRYVELGYECYFLNALKLTAEEKEAIFKLITDKTIAFAGNSGVGKSTLVNQLFGKDFIKTGAISEKSKKGKQTTTQTVLYYHKEHNCFLADTPGYSMIDLVTLKDANIDQLFPELAELQGQCRFDNCKHLTEPQCAIKQGLEQGKILPSRYDSYLKLITELKKLKPKY